MSAALCNLTYENDANRIRVGEVGGSEALVRLCRHSRSQRVLEQARHLPKQGSIRKPSTLSPYTRDP